MIEDAIFKVLSTTSGVTSIVGSSPARIYPILAPEVPTYPFIVYHAISEVVPNAMGSGTTDVVRRRYQFDCWDKTGTGAQMLADAVTAALDRYQADVVYSGGRTLISDVYRLGVQDIFDFESRKWKRAADLEIVFVEGV